MPNWSEWCVKELAEQCTPMRNVDLSPVQCFKGVSNPKLDFRLDSNNFMYKITSFIGKNPIFASFRTQKVTVSRPHLDHLWKLVKIRGLCTRILSLSSNTPRCCKKSQNSLISDEIYQVKVVKIATFCPSMPVQTKSPKYASVCSGNSMGDCCDH